MCLTGYLARFGNALIRDLQENRILGRDIVRIHAIEFQKRGYPQKHIVLTVQQVDKLHNVGDSNSAISVEISNREVLPLLWGTTSSTMMYCLCAGDNRGHVSMIENERSKNSPKDFRDHTGENILGYPKYWRRHNGRKVEKCPR